MEVYNLFYGAVYLFTGLWTGSFLNVCVWRFPRQLSPIKGRSSCPRCGHALSPGDLVPVFSWLCLRGKCRYCHRPISRRYPLTEALTGLVFLLCFYVFGAGFRSVPACLFASALITAAWIDWDFTYIPDGISLFILLAGLLSLIPLPAYGLLTRFSWKSLGDHIVATVLIGSALFIVSRLTGGGIGGGDIKLLAASGFYLGLPRGLLALFGGYVLAAAWVVPALMRGKIHRRSSIPMAPFFAVSLILSLLWGEQILNWYLNLVLRGGV